MPNDYRFLRLDQRAPIRPISSSSMLKLASVISKFDDSMKLKNRLFNPRLLLAIALVTFSSCKTFEYEPDEITIDENSVQLGNVGFKGFSLNPPDAFELLSDETWLNDPAGKPLQALRSGYKYSGDIDYHFHQDFVFRKGNQLVYFVPFQNKGIRKFRFTPPDILERYLVDWVRDAEFSKIIEYDLAWRTESNPKGHSTVILYSKEPKNGWVYEERIMTGDLNEMFIFAGFAPANDASSLSYTLQQLESSLTVIR